MSTEAIMPGGQPAVRVTAMPANANVYGDIFGGWLMAQMDLAATVPARERARGRVATVAVEAISFHKPVRVGDLVNLSRLSPVRLSRRPR